MTRGPARRLRWAVSERDSKIFVTIGVAVVVLLVVLGVVAILFGVGSGMQYT
ncbi:MAG: hypothetical protein JWP32_1766 [Schumannella sp.]|nr:hypothetical protein [Schumannella sp.]